MGIGDWITIISIGFAVIAIYPANERAVISYKLWKYEIPLLIFWVFFLLYLIKFDEIACNLHFLKIFYVDWGIKSNDWALLLFLGFLTYSVWRLFYRIPNLLPNERLIKFYLKKLNQEFEMFFALFNKYEKKSSDVRYFESYKEIVFNSKFVAEISNRNPYLFIALLEKMDNNTFKPFFIHVLNDIESVFYQEIKKNYNSYSVEPSNNFLFTVCKNKPKLFIDIGGLKIVREWYIIHLQTERMKGNNSRYNQPPELLIDDYAYTLPLYNHVSFIALLYNEAISEHHDFSTLSKKYTNMQSIFSLMIERIIDNIDSENYNTRLKDEYPLGYHYIISEIFNVIGHWLDEFCEDENYENNSSLIIFIPFCFSLSMKSLFKGLGRNLISIDFIKRQYRYHLFNTYFSNKLKPEIEKEINDRCIKAIPVEHLENILEFALDDILAVSYNSFKENTSSFNSPNRQTSLRQFLEDNEMI